MLRKYCFAVLLAGLALALLSCTKRKPEEIDYAPDSPFNPYPPDCATNVDHTTLDVTLRWTATDPNSGDVLTYAIYFDTLNPPETQMISGLSSPSHFMTGLSYNTTYYWKLYITDDKSVTTSGPVWSFTTLPHANTAPVTPTYLEPLNDTIGTYPTLQLAWSSSEPNGISDTVNFDIYLGPTVVPSLIKSTPGFSCLACCLDYSTLYRWQVIATDNHGAVSAGPLARFTTRESPWFLREPMPLPRQGFATATANNKIFVIGGTDENNTATGTVQQYDPGLNSWTIRNPMPTPRYNLAAATVNGLIYAVGGKNITDSIVGATEVYDPATDSWTTKSPMIVPRYGLTAQSVNGLIYAVSGLYPAISRIYAVVEVYTPATNRWIKLKKPRGIVVWPPYARINTMSGAITGKIYVAGGFEPWNNTFSNALNIFDPSTGGWSYGMELSGPRTAGLGIVANGCFYLIGGYNGEYLRRVEKYDPATDAWALRGDMLNSRSGCGGGTLNNSIFVVGGVDPYPVLITEEYQIGLDP
ncbi:MAG: kelch repeat-containing protein [bacterium]|nr:kelch repeat-containing protein [bacterium]